MKVEKTNDHKKSKNDKKKFSLMSYFWYSYFENERKYRNKNKEKTKENNTDINKKKQRKQQKKDFWSIQFPTIKIKKIIFAYKICKKNCIMKKEHQT